MNKILGNYCPVCLHNPCTCKPSIIPQSFDSNNMTKQEIIEKCTNGLSEDINGKYYQLYDVNKLFDLITQKVCECVCSNLNQIENYSEIYSLVKKEMEV